jgi:hypothetical protein
MDSQPCLARPQPCQRFISALLDERQIEIGKDRKATRTGARADG